MKYLYLTFGSLALALGIAGIFLPLLPTTPLLLLASWCYCRSSPRLAARLLGHPAAGPLVRNYRDGRGIALAGKLTSLALLWTTIPACIIFVAGAAWLRLLLGAVLAGVTWHIAALRTLPKEETVRYIVRRGEPGERIFMLEAGGRPAGSLRIVRPAEFFVETDSSDTVSREAAAYIGYYCAARGLMRAGLEVRGAISLPVLEALGYRVSPHGGGRYSLHRATGR